MRLIDADALLQKFNDKGIQITFDLPVEEILGEDVDIDDFSMLVQDAIKAYRKMVIDTIKNQPTAFDTEKVVEQLEKLKQHNKKLSEGAYLEDDKSFYFCAYTNFAKAIDIVKKGGVE